MRIRHAIIGGLAIASVVTTGLVAHNSTIPACIEKQVLPFDPQGWLPDGKCTPGVADPTLTKDVLCSPSFTTKTIRNVSQTEKDQVAREYGIPTLKGYEVDHLISLELGGSNDIKNLWPEPYFPNEKDLIENKLHKEVCSGQITLQQAQREISTDWTKLK